MAYQFQINGRGIKPVRQTWHEAADDAVALGRAVWGCDGRCVAHKNDGEIVEVSDVLLSGQG